MNGADPGKKVLGIVASMRRLGNCELFVKEVGRLIPEMGELSLIRLPELVIKPCTGCYRCIVTGTCPQEDDISFLIRSIAEADGLIIAAPVYFLGAQGSLKAFLDRAFSFYGSVNATQGKPAILACTYAMRDKVGITSQTLRTLAAILCLDVAASVRLQCALPGDVLKNSRHRRTAARLAPMLFGRRGPVKNKGCPFCGNEIVRMAGDDLICTLCHGRFTQRDGHAVPGREGWPIGRPRFIREHTRWLLGMKNRFAAEKEELLRLSLPYKKTGIWLTPPSREGRG